MFHPHIHCIVPGGGLSPSGIEFKHSRKKFFIPVKVLSRKFRGKFLCYMQERLNGERLVLPQGTNLKELKDKIYSIDWVVYCKPPFQSPEYVIEYLGRYTHKVAISNNRILSCKDGMVTFKWRDYRDKKKEKVMSLTVNEFMRRFLLHILPQHFFKIRHYGLLSNKNKKTKLLKSQKLTGIKLESLYRRTKQELLQKIFGFNVLCCPHCGSELVNRYFLSFDVLRE